MPAISHWVLYYFRNPWSKTFSVVSQIEIVKEQEENAFDDGDSEDSKMWDKWLQLIRPELFQLEGKWSIEVF